MLLVKTRVRVMQQALDPTGYGGVSVEYRALAKSKLTEEYEFIPLILKTPHKGINLHDIKFYYSEIKREKPDIVQIRGAAVDGLNAEIAAKFASPKTKVMLCVHGMYSDLVYINWAKHFVAQFIVEPLCFFLADGISFVYQGAKNRAKLRNYKKKFIQYVYNRMPDYSTVNRKQMCQAFREKYGIPQDAIVGLYCGRVTKEKGIDYLSSAIKRVLSEKHEKAYFVVVGDGASLNEVMQEFAGEKRVVFTGALSDVVPALSGADYFIQPSLHENHSIALLEAMAMKLPTIATDVGGNREIIQDKRFGMLIEKANVDQLSFAIDEMLVEQTRTAFVQIIHDHSFSEFSDLEVDKQLKRAYVEVLEK